MPSTSNNPRYSIDCSALNRFFWFREDTDGIYKTRKEQLVTIYGEDHVNATLEKLEELIKTGEIISHVEVRDEVRNAKNTQWNRWILRNSLFKGFRKQESAILVETARKDSEFNVFLTQEKPGRAKHADPWVFAQAMDRGLVIIAADGELKKFAERHGLKYIDLFELVEREKNLNPTLFEALPEITTQTKASNVSENPIN